MSEIKRLYKNKAMGKIDGVCAGFSEYFNADVTLIRVLWVLVSLAYGSGVIAYILCMLIMPDKSEIN